MNPEALIAEKSTGNGAAHSPEETARAVASLMAKAEHLYLESLSWTDYQAILDTLEKERRLRHTYDRGKLELMTRSWEHERPKMLWAYLVFVLAEELDCSFEPGGEVTLQREDMDRGLEPDQCFWLQNADRVRGKTKLDFQVDPPPDLFLEIEVSRTVLDRLGLLAALGVPEVWRIAAQKVQVGLLQEKGRYDWGAESRAFSGLDVGQLAEFLKGKESMDRMDLLRLFRKWVREQRSEGKF